MSLANHIDFLKRLKQNSLHGLGDYEQFLRPVPGSPLRETTGFGSNPGNLRMFTFVPEQPQQPAALVVVLHGCGQSAAQYDLGAGWSTLAKHYGFALLMPEQQAANNAQGCFNWFNPEDTRRDSGEAQSIRQMIARIGRDTDIDRQRVFVTGLSAGGAMTSVMLATYPELFAAGAIIAGLPYGVASNVREALNGMFQSPARPGRELGDLVRKASKHRGSWPKVSVWHGSADRTVNPANADAIVKQWLDVHGLPSTPMSEGTVDGYPRQLWWNSDGDTVVESYTITNMAHGTPLGVADNDEHYGAQGAFLIEAGISSSYHIAHFFGLTEGGRKAKTAAAGAATATRAPATPAPIQIPVPAMNLSDMLQPLTDPNPHDDTAQASPRPLRRRGIDVGAVITRALTAAGLIKQG